MEPILRLTLLYDYYGELLTGKQRAIFEMYHFNDMSLGEISAELGISPQGARDLLKRTEKLLTGYELGLGLVDKHAARRRSIDGLAEKINELAISPEEKAGMIDMLSGLQ